jgi:HK97 family phage prohead protease
LAKLRGHYERIGPTAFDDVLNRSNTDVRALVEHNPLHLLGRQSAGTLRLRVDGEGLGFEVDLPDTSYAKDLRTLISRGDLTGASFGFIPGEDEWSNAPDGMQIRTHTSVRELVDVSAVTFPAYGDSAVALRNYDFSQNSARSVMIRARARVHLKGVSK